MLSKMQYLAGSIFSLFLVWGFAQAMPVTANPGFAVSQVEPEATSYQMTDTVPSDDSAAFTRVEVEARFPGGDAGWRNFVGSLLNPDVPVKKGAPVGKYVVVVQFIIDRDGNVADILPLTNHGFGMEEEVVRVIRKSPKWTPARQNGRTVRVYRKQPVNFEVIEDKKKRKKG